MRQIIIILVILLAAGSGRLRAAVTVNEKVLQSFHNKFSSAKEVNWNELTDKGLYEARFIYNDQHVEAFYNEDGELISTARLVTKELLPIMVMNKLSQDFSNYDVRQIVELTSNDAVSYLVTAYNAKEAVLVQIYSGGDAHRIKRTKNK